MSHHRVKYESMHEKQKKSCLGFNELMTVLGCFEAAWGWGRERASSRWCVCVRITGKGRVNVPFICSFSSIIRYLPSSLHVHWLLAAVRLRIALFLLGQRGSTKGEIRKHLCGVIFIHSSWGAIAEMREWIMNISDEQKRCGKEQKW